MAKVAYTVKTAAKAASVREKDVEIAIHTGKLIARRVNGTPVVLHSELAEWLKNEPDWLS